MNTSIFKIKKSLYNYSLNKNEYINQLELLDLEYKQKIKTIYNEYTIKNKRLYKEYNEKIELLREAYVNIYYYKHQNKIDKLDEEYKWKKEKIEEKHIKLDKAIKKENNCKKIHLRMMKSKKININIMSGENRIYNCLYNLIEDLKENFASEKKISLLYEGLIIDMYSIEFLDSIEEIETIDLQLIISNKTLYDLLNENLDLNLDNIKKYLNFFEKTNGIQFITIILNKTLNKSYLNKSHYTIQYYDKIINFISLSINDREILYYNINNNLLFDDEMIPFNENDNDITPLKLLKELIKNKKIKMGFPDSNCPILYQQILNTLTIEEILSLFVILKNMNIKKY